MNSCLYQCRVMHNRLSPRKHKFYYTIFMFYLDLDEIDMLSQKLRFLSRNNFNLFNFKDKEHLQLPVGNPDKTKNTKQHLLQYVKEKGLQEPVHKIYLLTNLSVLGYNFNPVSFYFCFDTNNYPLCCVIEISNTFGEMKLFFLDKNCFTENIFRLETKKYFYVSPFIDHDASFDFNLSLPGEKINLRIDDIKNGERFFISTVTGDAKPLSDGNLFFSFLRFPFVTLKIIAMIHWNAFILWLKKIPYYKKEERQDLQRDIHRKNEEG